KNTAVLMQREGFTVAFLGGPSDPHVELPGALDWTGALTLDQAMAAIALSEVHLAADTGTGHIAAAYGVPVVSVFGYTKAWKYRPYTDRAIVLDAGKSMDGIEPAQIVEAALSLTESRH